MPMFRTIFTTSQSTCFVSPTYSTVHALLEASYDSLISFHILGCTFATGGYDTLGILLRPVSGHLRNFSCMIADHRGNVTDPDFKTPLDPVLKTFTSIQHLSLSNPTFNSLSFFSSYRHLRHLSLAWNSNVNWTWKVFIHVLLGLEQTVTGEVDIMDRIEWKTLVPDYINKERIELEQHEHNRLETLDITVVWRKSAGVAWWVQWGGTGSEEESRTRLF